MLLFSYKIPSSHFLKMAQIIPEQVLDQTVTILKDAIPYIKCEIQSTIQHEAGHRMDQEGRDEDIYQMKSQEISPSYYATAQVMPFDQFTSKSRVEPIAEQEEEDCEPLLPQPLSEETEKVNLNQLFEEAKTAAQVEPEYKQDIRAGHLPPQAQGMFVMQDFSGLAQSDLMELQSSSGNAHTDVNNNLWGDVRKIAQPFIVQDQQQETRPATYQGQGDGAVTPDIPGVSQIPPWSAAPTVPSVPGRQSI